MHAKQADTISRFSRQQSFIEIFARIENAAQEGKVGYLFRKLEDWEVDRLSELGYTVEFDEDGVWIFWGWDLSHKTSEDRDSDFNPDYQDCKFTAHFRSEDPDTIWIEI